MIAFTFSSTNNETSRTSSWSYLVTLCLSCAFVCGKEFPKWPWDFKFSLTGPVSGYHCVQLLELVPQGYYWNDNHFCVRKNSAYVDIEMKWSNQGNLVFFQKP